MMKITDDFVYLSESEEEWMARLIYEMLDHDLHYLQLLDQHNREVNSIFRKFLDETRRIKEHGKAFTLNRFNGLLNLFDKWNEILERLHPHRIEKFIDYKVGLHENGKAIEIRNGFVVRTAQGIYDAHCLVNSIWRNAYNQIPGAAYSIGDFSNWVEPNPRKKADRKAAERETHLRYINQLIDEHPEWSKEELRWRIWDDDLIEELGLGEKSHEGLTSWEIAETEWEAKEKAFIAYLDEQERKHDPFLEYYDE